MRGTRASGRSTLDGRPLPDNDQQPWWFGYSTGKWVGDTLVVETSWIP